MPKTRSYGATVTLHVVPIALGRMLHRLEYREDIHVVEIGEDRVGKIIVMRSDPFPASWEGADVRAVIGESSPGVDRFVPIARRARRASHRAA
jgi:hypothetical protein